MEIKLHKLPKSRVKLEIKVSAIEMGEHFEEALRRLSHNVNIPGFRPGFAPLHLAQRQIGEEKIHQEVIETVVPLAYYQALKKENLTPVQEPAIEIQEFGRGKPLLFTAEVDIMPEVKLGDYHQIKIQNKEKKSEVTEKEIEGVLAQLQHQTAELKPLSRPSQKGDYLEIDFEAFYQGQPLPQSKSINHPVIIGQGQFVKEFEDNLLGLKINDTKTFSVSFKPDFHNKEVAGKKIDFKVKVKNAKEIVLPKMNDAWAMRLGKKNLAELKKAAKDSLLQEKAQKESEKQEAEMIEKICEISETELPESLVLAEVQRLAQGVMAEVESTGITFNQYLKNLKKEEKDFLAGLREPAEKNLKISLVLNAIRQKEGVGVEDNELEELIKQLEKQKITVKDEERERLRHQLAIKKTVAKLKQKLIK